MRRIILVLMAVALCFSVAWSQDAVRPYAVIDAVRHDTSPPIRDIWKPSPPADNKTARREIPNVESIYIDSNTNQPRGVDQALQDGQGELGVGAPILNWEGMGLGSGGTGVPPDTDGDVGPNHYVQMVNTSFAIWDKNGNQLVGPTPNNTLWSGFGGPCEFGNDGDPIVLYDPLADRWILSQFDFGSAQCVAVSTTPDPTGGYHRYEFPTPGNDYPKLAVWDDAYYATIRNFSSGFQFDIYAWERDQMLQGLPAQAVVFNMSTIFPGSNNFLAADIDGTTPPPEADPQYVVGLIDPSVPQTDLGYVEVRIDWNNTANSTMTGPFMIPVTPFDGNVCNFRRNCIPQPNTSNGVDGFADALMHRLAYRNFGTHQAMVATHAVDIGDFPDHAGIRWYEFRNTIPGNGWSTFQDGTFSPDADHRWMPSIAMNENGDIAVGYSVSSPATFPSIRYAARRASDPLGELTLGEGEIITGHGSQTGSQRWGDYSAMAVDPSDETTFWYTQEYFETTSSAGWQTRVASFTATDNGLMVTATPDNPPVIIPGSTGGSFDFTIEIENGTGSSQTVDLWTYAQRLGGGKTDNIFVQQNITIASGATETFNLTQNVPAIDPSEWTYNAKIGDFNTQDVINSSAFNFTISSSASVSAKAPAISADKQITEWKAILKGESASESISEVPESITLAENYPNPFNPTTNIRYGLDKPSHVKLAIYNTLGQEVKTLVNQSQSAGFKTVTWDATNNAGQQVAGGVYLYRLEAGDVVITKKMSLLK